MTGRSDGGCPPEILEWIAWYPDGGLTDGQRGAVEAHAAACTACREELAMLAGRIEAPVAPPDPERLFARVLAQVEDEALGAAAALDAPVAPVPPAPGVRRAPPARRRVHRGGLGARLAAGLALALLVGGLGGWLGRDWIRSAGPRPAQAATTVLAAERPDGDPVVLDVAFHGHVTADRIHVALRGLGARVVAGPSPVGRYRIALPPETDPDAAAALLLAEGTGVASFAEPAPPR